MPRGHCPCHDPPAAPADVSGAESHVSGQLESNHFFRTGDSVRKSDGMLGIIIEGFSLYAIVEWSNGDREELDQFDPRVEVMQRSGGS